MTANSGRESPAVRWIRIIAEILLVPWFGTLTALLLQFFASIVIRSVGLGSSDPVRRADLGGWTEIIVMYALMILTGISIRPLLSRMWPEVSFGSQFIWVLPTLVFFITLLQLEAATSPYPVNPLGELFGPNCERTSCLNVFVVTGPMIVGLAYSMAAAWIRRKTSR